MIQAPQKENLWINKYKPKKLNEIIGNNTQINKIKEWLLNQKTNSLIVSGNQGIGKTITIKLILEEAGYRVKIINPNDIKDHRIFDDFNDYYNHTKSIFSKISINKNINNKIALIFDETENITLTSEKKFVIDIYKENNKIKAFPLIFISNNKHSKLLNDLKKGSIEINFNLPTENDLILLLDKICEYENINWTSNNLKIKLIEFSQWDIRRLVNLLEELSWHLDGKKIVNEIKLDEFIEKSRQKNIDVGLFDSTERLLNNYLDYDNIIKLYESEKVLLPLMIHENYLKKVLNKNKSDWSSIINNIANISDSISKGDNIETSIYTDQNWYLQNIHGFFTCLNTSYWINKLNPSYRIDTESIKFSSDLNKTSLKNINRKNIFNLIKLINNKSNQEILMLNQLCNHLINNGKEEEIIKILNGYNKDITIKEIELCLKIDKTMEFNTLGSKDKKKITKQLKG
jgi:replication factor C subunit 1